MASCWVRSLPPLPPPRRRRPRRLLQVLRGLESWRKRRRRRSDSVEQTQSNLKCRKQDGRVLFRAIFLSRYHTIHMVLPSTPTTVNHHQHHHQKPCTLPPLSPSSYVPTGCRSAPGGTATSLGGATPRRAARDGGAAGSLPWRARPNTQFGRRCQARG